MVVNAGAGELVAEAEDGGMSGETHWRLWETASAAAKVYAPPELVSLSHHAQPLLPSDTGPAEFFLS